MNTTVMANFETIDGAAQAASDLRKRCGDLKSVKIKSHSIKNDTDNIALLGIGAMYANQPGFPYMQNNGLIPTPIALPFSEAVYSKEYNNARHATLEVVTSNDSTREVCATIRQDGGISVKTFPGERRDYSN